MNPAEVGFLLEGCISPEPGISEAVAGIPTGSLALDSVLATHGWPVGQTSHVQGDAAVGKTTLLYHTIAQAQKTGLTVAYCNFHGDFNPGYASRLGVVLPELMVFHHTLLFNASYDMWRYPGDVFVFDGISNQRTANQIASRTAGRTTVVTTQVAYRRARYGPAHLSEVLTPEVPYSAVRVALRPASPALGGICVRAEVLKDAYAAPREQCPEADFQIRFGQGIDQLDELVSFGVKFGLIKKAGNWHEFPGTGVTTNGRQQAADLLRLGDYSWIREKLERDINTRIYPESGMSGP